MISIGDTITIKGYDYDKMMTCKRKFEVLQIFPNFVLCKNKKAKYRECFGIFELIENGYVPNFADVYDEPQISHPSKYDISNKLLQEYYA